MIENDNNRARTKERNRFNDKVQNLVNHVRKLDPRYQSFQAEENAARLARKHAQDEEKRVKREQEAERLRVYREELAEFYRKEEEEAILRGDVEEVFEEEFRCQVCKKSFKKEGQLKNHLQSKKHKEQQAKVDAMRAELQLDEETEDSIAAAEAQKQEREAEERKAQEEEKARFDEDGREDSDPEAIESRKKHNKVVKGELVEELADDDLADMDEWTHKSK